MRSARLVPVLALLVLLSGCGGAPAGDVDGTTTSPTGTTTIEPTTTAVTTTTKTDETGPSVSFPAGTAEEGIVDVGALMDAHRDSLSGESFGYDYTRSVNRSDTALLPHNQTFRVAYEDDTEINYMVKRETAPNAPVEVYAEGPVLFRQYLDENPAYRYGYDRVDDGDADPRLGFSGPTGTIRHLLVAGTWTYVESTSEDGEQYLHFAAGESPDERLADFHATVSITTDGTISHLEASYVRAGPEPNVSVTVSYRTMTPVEPPQKPDWIAAIPQVSVTSSGDGSVFALAHDGGDPVPAGTNVSASLVGEDTRIVDRNLTIPTAMEQGDSVYIYPVEAGEEPRLEISSEPPASEDVLAVSKARFTLNSIDDVRMGVRAGTAAESG